MAQGQVDAIAESMTQVEAQAQQDDAETLDAVGWALVGIGGAAVATGVVLLELDASSEGAAAVSASAAPLREGGALVQLGGRF